jgi:hypothetical protein
MDASTVKRNLFAVAGRNITSLHLFLIVVSVIATALVLSACIPNAPLSPTETGEPPVSATEVLATTVPTAEPTVTPTNAPRLLGYQDATYLIEGQPVTLVNGLSEIEAVPGSVAKIITRFFGNEAFGDLNGDDLEDVTFLLTQNSGGTGTFFYVVVVLQTETGYQGTNAILLGDRIAPQTTRIENGTIIVNFADRNPGESFDVAPSLGVSKYLQVKDTLLEEVDAP